MTRTVLERWYLRIENRAQETQRPYKRVVNGFLKFVKKPIHQTNNDDVQRFLNTYAGRAMQDVALAAIKSVLKVIGRTVGNITLKPKKEKRLIIPYSLEEIERMVKSASSLKEQARILVLHDSGGRSGAICSIKVEDWRGDYVILQGDTAKNHITSIAPISKRTQEVLREYVAQYRPEGFLFGGRPRNVLKALKKTARRAGITRTVYVHLFRHTRALAYRKAEAQEDLVTNAMGWSSPQQYNMRYGKRPAMETVAKAREIVEHQTDSTTTAIDRLAKMLDEGKIDLPAYKASLVALQRPKLEDKEKEIQGYQ